MAGLKEQQEYFSKVVVPAAIKMPLTEKEELAFDEITKGFKQMKKYKIACSMVDFFLRVRAENEQEALREAEELMVKKIREDAAFWVVRDEEMQYEEEKVQPQPEASRSDPRGLADREED
jgi:hypothetical protein